MNGEHDVVVIGAGPAGAMAALRAARRGACVLLVDKKRFPREKACGCCLNGAALAALARAGLGELPSQLGGRSLRWAELAAGPARATVALPESISVSRAALDSALVSAAVDAGAEFVDGTTAHPDEIQGDRRKVQVGAQTWLARCVVVATGLDFGKPDTSGHRIGLAAILPDPARYDSGHVYMACGTHGYVGLVVLEDGRLDVASAMDPAFVRARGGAGHAVAEVLTSCQMRLPPGLIDARWRGTPLLTRRTRMVADERLLVVGDAAGYVEPFTGEGIGWALAGGWAAGELAAQPWTPASADEWVGHVKRLRRRQIACRVIAGLLRRPRVTRWAVRAISCSPRWVRPILGRIHRPLPMDSVASGA